MIEILLHVHSLIMSFLWSVLTIGFTIISAIVSFIATVAIFGYQAVAAVPTIVIRLFSILIASALAIYTFAKDHRSVVLVGIIIALILFVGPYGVTETSYFIEVINQLVACGSPVTEVINKYVMHGIIVSGWQGATPFLNNALAFFGSRFSIGYLDVVAVIRCFEATGNFQYWFDLPAATGLGSLLFAFVSAPYQNKVEPFPQGEWGYYFPLENNQPISVPRYEFDPVFQAQGPAVNPSTDYPNGKYFVRSNWVNLSRLFQSVFQLFVETFSDLARPTQRLFPSFYISIEQKESIWRKVADIITQVFELITQQAFWPFGPGTNPKQDERDEANRYIGKFWRTVGSFLSDASLIINDVTTTTRPIQQNPTACEPLPDPANTILKLFRGFPVIDFFIPGTEFNLNIFRSNIVFCQFMVFIQGQSCFGLALGSLSFRTGPPAQFCPEWTGVVAPLPDERINYLGRIVGSVKRAALIFIQEGSVQDADASARAHQGAIIATMWLNFLIDSLIFVVNALGQIIPFDGCSIAQTTTYWLEVRFSDAFIATLEFAYNDRCDLAIFDVESQRNGFLCLIAFASRSNYDSFWGTLCDAVNTVDNFFPSLNVALRCTPGAKRNAGDAAPASRKLSWYEWYRVSLPYYSYETRQAATAFQYCFTNTNTSRLVQPYCNTTCAIGPCVDDAMDCVAEQLGSSGNLWKQWMAGTSIVRSAVRASAMLADAYVGCEDGDVHILYTTVNQTVSLMREATSRTAATMLEFSRSHEDCAIKARHENSTIYLQCLELDPLSDRWETTLDLHNISSNTLCGTMLRTYGIRFDLDSRRLPYSYTGCLHMFAFGARARAQNLTSEPLSAFVGEFTVLNAMSKVSIKPLREWNPNPRNSTWIDKVIERPLPGELHERGRESLLRGTKDDRLWKSVHSVSSLLYAYFNYQADLYEHVILSDTTGADKDRIDEMLYHKRVVTVAAAIGLDVKPVVQSRKRMQTAVAAVVEDRSLKPSKGIAEVAMIYGNSLLWVDRMYATAENSMTAWRAQEDGLDFLQLEAGDSSLLEFRVRQRFAGNPNGGKGSTYLPPVIGMRRIADLSSTITLASINSTSSAVSTEVDSFSEMELFELINALDVFSRTSIDHTTKKNADTAVNALRALDIQISQANSVGDVIAMKLGSKTAKVGRIAMRILWNLINRQLRIESLPATQTAAVLINLLTTGERGELERWMRKENGYIVGLGYVPRDEYDVYMQSEEHARSVMLSGYFSPITDEERNMVHRSWYRLFSARHRLKRNVQMQATTLVNGTLVFPGDTAHARFQARMRDSLRKRIDFRHRAKFLIEHGLHTEDEHFHETVSQDWRRYHKIKHLSSHVLYQTAAQEVATNAWWIDLVDWIIFLFTRTDNVFEDALLQFEGSIGDLVNAVFDDIISRLTQFFENFFDSLACPGPGAYRLGGTLPYSLGCVRFPERLFDWFTHFPRYDPNPGSLPYGGIFNLYTGPGFMQWPDEMLKCNCSNERDPNMYPYPQSTFWSDPVGFWNSTNLRLVNACDDPVKANDVTNCTANPADEARPLCASLNCDYCVRTWYSAEEAGFTSWLHNVAVWGGMTRELIRISVGAAAVNGFWYIVVLFILTEFTAILPIGGLVTSVLIIIGMLFGNTYIQQMPELFTFQYLLFLFARAFGRGIGWIVFGLYFFNLVPIVFFAGPNPIFGNALIFLAENAMLDNILLYLTEGARYLVEFFDGFYDFIEVPATFDPAITILSAYITAVPPTSAVLYSFFSVYNFILVAVIIAGVVFGGYVAVYAFVLPLGVVFAALFAPFVVLFTAAVSLFTAFRLIALSSKADEHEEKLEKLRRENESLKDEVSRIDRNQLREVQARRNQ